MAAHFKHNKAVPHTVLLNLLASPHMLIGMMRDEKSPRAKEKPLLESMASEMLVLTYSTWEKRKKQPNMSWPTLQSGLACAV